MKRALLLVALLAAGCGSSGYTTSLRGPQQAHIVPPSPTSLRFSEASNRQAARENVKKLMRLVVLPSGASAVATVPASAPVWFKDQARGFRRPGVASVQRFWIVDRTLRQTVLYAETFMPPRPRPEPRYSSPQSTRVGSRPSRSYTFMPIPGRAWSRWLNVSFAPLPGGATAVFARAGVEWNLTSPRSAVIPRGVKQIDITSRTGAGRPNVLVHVRNPYDVGWIVALTNGLGTVPGHIACFALFAPGPTVTLRFRAADGRVLARATVPYGATGLSGPCNPLQLTVGGRQAPPLIGSDLLVRIQRLLDVDLAPPVPRDVSACLRRDGWKVQNSPPELTVAKNGKRWTITFHRTGKVTLHKPVPLGLKRCLGARPGIVIYG